MERLAQLRPAQRARDAPQRHARPRRSLPAAARAGLLADRNTQGLRGRGEARAVAGDRPGLRARRRQLGAALRRGSTGGRAPAEPHDRHRALRRGGGNRPRLLRPLLSARARRRGRRARVRAAERDDAGLGQGGTRALRDARQGATRRHSRPRWRPDADDDAVRRRSSLAPRRSPMRSRPRNRHASRSTRPSP